MSSFDKYTKKIAKAEKSISKLSPLEENDEIEELKEKVAKYKAKLSKLNQSEEEERVIVDKSGVTLLLFYAYVEPAWSIAQHSEAIKWAETLLTRLNCSGRLRVAREGFNGTLTGPYDGIREFTDEFRKYKNGYFSHMNNKDDFKLKDNLPIGQKFPHLKVFAVNELVNYGLGIDNAPSVFKGGAHLDPEDYHKKLHEPNTVVVDVRNSYEAEIGRFAPVGGAEYIDPQMRISTEFPIWAKDNIEKLKDKQVLMYCTGGIRCERASALMRSLGHENVFQLKGGIHNYLEEYADKGGGCWVGENYTFDKRFAHGAGPAASDTANGSEHTPAAVPTPAPATTAPAQVIGHCSGCSKPWSKYRGKKRCVCGVPLLLCSQCIKNDADKFGAKCSLCKLDAQLGRKPFNKRLAKDGINPYSETGDAEEDENGRPVGSKSKRKDTHVCGVCQEEFKSRNALFKHVNDFKHMNRKRQRKPAKV